MKRPIPCRSTLGTPTSNSGPWPLTCPSSPDLDATNINLSGVSKAEGSITAPSWRLNASVALNLPKDQVRLSWRRISESTINANWIQCTSGCPAATALNPTSAYNRVAASDIFDLSLNHRFEVSGHASQVYFVVQNLLNTQPPAIPGQVLSPGFFQGSIGPSIYDRIGRAYRLGIRMDF